MKLLFHLNSMGRGGAERVVSILANELANRGEQVVIATEWFSEKEYPLVSAVTRLHVGLSEKDDKKGRIAKAVTRFIRLRQTIKREKPDIVISFCNKANFRSAFALFGMRVPLLVSVRNDPKVDYAPYKLPTRWMERKAQGCVFQTPDARSFFGSKLQEKGRIILNPLDEKYLVREDERKPEKTIVNVGRIAEQKNQMLLLKAFQKITKEFPEVVLKIYGDVQDEHIYEEMKQFILQEHLTERVFLKEASDSIKEEIKNAGLFVLSSDFEGMPNALIEAMSLGVPCISTNCPCGGSKMLINENVSGKLVPVGDVNALADAMKEMLSDTENAECMGRNARDIVKKVNPKQICEEWMLYIEQLLKG